jgi:hypothetical protein
MKKQAALLCACIVVSILQFSSCVKPPRDFEPRDGNNVFDNCRIKRITLRSPAETINFVYNSKGDPVTVTPSNIYTGHSKKAFYYDKKGRLIKMIGFYTGDDQYETLHYYTYDNKNRITVDTIYYFGVITTGAYYGKSISYLKYDNLNRIATDSTVVLSPFPNIFPTHYTYNEAGNRTNYTTSYDDKLNIHRTNKIWMFVDRDYSVNNPGIADSYSYYKLPLSFSNPEGFVDLLGFSIGNSVIEYDCK